VLSFSLIGCGGSGGGGDDTVDNLTSLFPSDEKYIEHQGEVTTIIDDEGYENKIISKRIIIEFTRTAKRQNYNDLTNYLTDNNYNIIGQIPVIRLIQIEIDSDDNLYSVLNYLNSMSYVQYAHLDRIYSPLFDPVPASLDSWIPEINAKDAWDISTESKDIKIGIVDGAVAWNSGHFQTKVNDIEDATPFAYSNNSLHGTTMAALAASPGDDGHGMCGVAWKNPIVFYNVDGPSGATSSSEIKNGIIECIDRGAKVINVSQGPSLESGLPNWYLLLRQQNFRSDMAGSVEYASGNNALIVFSSGNNQIDNDNTLFHPLFKDKDYYEERWLYNAMIITNTESNKSSIDIDRTRGDTTDLAAGPTDNINFADVNGSIHQWDGMTSAAAALVSGSAALIWSVNPDLSPINVKNILIETGDKTNNGTTDDGSNIPTLNLFKAITHKDVNGSLNEICDDSVDNDNDGHIDCNDSDCDGDPACSSSGDELAAYYPFNENANDESGNENHATGFSGVDFAQGVEGQAASFDGIDDYFRVPYSPELITPTWTISAWIYNVNLPTSPLPDGYLDSHIIIATDESTQNRHNTYMMLIQDRDKDSIAYFSANYEPDNSETNIGPRFKGIYEGQWQFVTYTRDIEGNSKIYIDGLQVGNTVTDESTPTQLSADILIGKNYDPRRHFDGYIDELRIYNYALSDTEIQQLYDDN